MLRSITILVVDMMTEIFSLMFLDSEIARSYKQVEFKVRYSIQYGIAAYSKQQLLGNFRNSLFSFHFDETTASKV